MCTYATEHVDDRRQRQGHAASWIPVQEATVYFDHPVHAQLEHTLNIDFRAPERGPSARVAVELSAASARELVACHRGRPRRPPPKG